MTIYLGEATPNLAMSTLAFPPLGVEIALIAKIQFSYLPNSLTSRGILLASIL